MKHFRMNRRYFDHGTFSVLYREDGSKVCCVAERPWRNNKPGESCVPEGTYYLYPHNSPKFGDCYALEAENLGVTRFGPSVRTHVLLHRANRVSELKGCLAPGMNFGVLTGEWAVMNSTSAFKSLLKELGGNVCTLSIHKD